ncbi:MAG: hypothetical protein AAGK97_14510, partial [Bacteroidota bacterium]
RAISGYEYQKRTGNEQGSFIESIHHEMSHSPSINQANAHGLYLNHGLYYKQLAPYFEKFGAENIQVLLFEELMQHKEKAMQSIAEFLNIDHSFSFQFDYLNKGTEPRFKRVNNFLFSKKNRTLRRNIKKVLMLDKFISREKRIKMANNILEKNSKQKTKIEIAEVDRVKMNAFFKEDITSMSRLLNKDLFQIWYGE